MHTPQAVPRRLTIPSGAARIPLTQTVITLIAAGAFAFVDFIAAYSAFLGGLACILPNTYAIWRVFGAGRGSHPSGFRTFGIMMRAEFSKFVLTGALFALIFWLVPDINPLAMFSVFVLAMLAGWIEAGLRINSYN